MLCCAEVRRLLLRLNFETLVRLLAIVARFFSPAALPAGLGGEVVRICGAKPPLSAGGSHGMVRQAV